MKKNEVIENFINGVWGIYKTPNNSITSIDGKVLQSYNTVIAYYNGKEYIITNRKFSKTTSSQQNILKKLLIEKKCNYKEVFDVGYYM